MYPKLPLFFLLLILTCSSIKPMEKSEKLLPSNSFQGTEYAKTNKQFLTTFLKGKKAEKCAQDLQLLMTGLLLQDMYFNEAEKVAIETEKGELLNNLITANKNKFPGTIVSTQKIERITGEIGTQEVIELNPTTKECAQNILLFGEHSRHLCTRHCDLSQIEKRIKNHDDKNSETVAYLESIILKKENLTQLTKYQTAYENTEKCVKNLLETQTEFLKKLNQHDDYLGKKTTELIKALSEGSSYAQDFKSFAPYQLELRDLYKQAKIKLKNSIQIGNKKKNLLKKYLKTSEYVPRSFPEVLPTSAEENWIPEHIISFGKQKSLEPSKKAQKKIQKTKITELQKIYHLHDALSKDEAQSMYHLHDTLTTCEDGSFTYSASDDEVIIQHPELNTTIKLYAMNTKTYPVSVELAKLPCTKNIQQWYKNPKEALLLQGYTNPTHHYYQPLIGEQNRMISIHALPQEIKKYVAKFAQQTTCNSRKNKEQQDIQITFCGELTYPSGKAETGLFIYLINSKTNKIYHHIFAESSYKKTFDIYLQQGNFNNALEKVFFPRLKDSQHN